MCIRCTYSKPYNCSVLFVFQWFQQHVFYVLQYLFFPGESALLVSRVDGTTDHAPKFISTRVNAAAGMFVKKKTSVTNSFLYM